MNRQGMGGRETAELLPPGTPLRRRYIVDGLLGRGVFGATYFGHDANTGAYLAIREYFPQALAVRAAGSVALSPKSQAEGELFFLGADLFCRQHLALADARGSENVVTVVDAFFENGTAYAVMERLEGVTLEQYLHLRKRRLLPDESMYIAASLADALLVVHSLSTLHFDINARSVFLCTDGSVKLIEFGAAKAGLRARRAVDDAEPWVDIAAVARTLYEALAGHAAGDEPRPNDNVPPQMLALFRQMLAKDARRISSVFEYRHALACVELGALCPDVSEQDVLDARLLPKIAASEHLLKIPASTAAPTPERAHHRPAPERGPETAERIAPAEPRETPAPIWRRKGFGRRVALIYGGIAVGTLILALILRALIR